MDEIVYFWGIYEVLREDVWGEMRKISEKSRRSLDEIIDFMKGKANL